MPLKDIFKTRNLVIMAMMVALKIVLSQFSIYITPTFQAISFAYLPGVVVSVLFGPVAGLIFGFVADTAGFIAKPMGPYFFGYAVSEMLANVIYAVFLYKRRVTVIRALLSRLLVTVFITFGLNFLWNMIMYGAAASKYFTGARLINNAAQLPLHVFLILFFARAALKIYPGGLGYGRQEKGSAQSDKRTPKTDER